MTRKIAGETLIVPVRSGVGDLESIYSLNDTGSRIWELIDGTNSVEQIAAKIAEEFDVTIDAARADVEEFIAELKSAGVVKLSA